VISNQCNNCISELQSSFEIKKKSLKDFSIALFGRTKVGKSTIREALTNGDGKTIGLGNQRTTKDVLFYDWKGLRIIDTPGIEAYKGLEDAQKANEVIQQCDMIIFLTSDDSIQIGEFEAMRELQEINKYFLVIMNVKDNMGYEITETEDGKKNFNLVDEYACKRVLDKPDRIFDFDRLYEHRSHINEYAKKILGIKYIDVIWIHALSAFLSNQQKDDFKKKLFFNLSQISKVYNKIALEIHNNGKQRRLFSFYDSLIYYLDSIEKMLFLGFKEAKFQSHFMKSKHKELHIFFEKFIEDSNIKIENRCSGLYIPIKEWIPDFVDEYLGQDSSQKKLKEKMEYEKNKIEKQMQLLIDEIVSELKEKLNEFTQQYSYDFQNIHLNPLDVNEIKKGQFNKILKWTGVALGALSTGALVFGEANFWNPVGWISLGLSVVTGILSWIFGNSEEKKWQKEKQKAKENLFNSFDKMELKTRGVYKTWFYENITTKGRKEMLEEVSIFINTLSDISQKFYQYLDKINDLKLSINKELFNNIFFFEGLNINEDNIINIAREQGIMTKILISNKCLIPFKIIKRLNEICGEQIVMISWTDNRKELIKNALFPANIEEKDIIIINEKLIKINTSKDLKSRIIGKRGVNIRLTEKILKLKIELK